MSEKKVTVKASHLYAQQNKRLHRGFSAIDMLYNEHKEEWLGVASSLANRPISGLSKMTLNERNKLIRYIARRGVRLFTPGVPRKMWDWKKGDAEMEFTYIRSDDSQIRYATSVWCCDLGWKLSSLYGLCRKKFGKDHPKWLTTEQLNDFVKIVVQRAKSAGVLNYYG